MKTARILFVVTSLLLTSIAFAQDKAKSGTTKTKAAAQKVDDMIDSFQIMEKGLWEAWKNRDAKPFDQHLTPDALMVDNGGLSDRATILKNITGCDVKNYSLGDFKLTKVDADAALLTYKATGVDATCDGQKIPETVFASTLFKKNGGTWRMLFHQETAAMPATSAAKE
jgi:hypothetical protein